MLLNTYFLGMRPVLNCFKKIEVQGCVESKVNENIYTQQGQRLNFTILRKMQILFIDS